MKAKDLRNSILQLAVQGKLVPQDPNDEPASVLLERIREEKHKLIAEGKAKFPKGGESIIYTGSDGSPYEKRVDKKGHVLSDECIADEVPFEIPKSWEWVRLKSVTQVNGGYAFKSDKYQKTGIRIIRISDFNENGFIDKDIVRYEYNSSLAPFLLEASDILMCMTGGTVGKTLFVASLKEPMLVNQRVATIKKPFELVSSFLYCVISCEYIRKVITESKNSTNDNISISTIYDFLIPIPPLTEQHHIVERINQLMPLVEEYGDLEDAREELDVTLPDRLRKSVLQMAVQGKLVPQDHNDEPASALLQRIRKERAKLIAEGKAKFPKGGESVIYIGSNGRHYEKRIDAKGRILSDECIEDEIPFELPDSWAWARLGDLGDWKAGATPAKTKPQYYEKGSIPWLLTGDLNDSIVTNIPNKITELALKECSVRLNPIGTVLVAMYGATIGKIGILGIPATTNQACCACILFDQETCGWLMAWLKYYKPHFIKLGEGGAQPNISREKIVSQLIPIPPLAEQHRIVERLDHILHVFTNR